MQLSKWEREIEKRGERQEASESCGDRVIKGLSVVPQWRKAKGVETLFLFKVTERTKDFDHVCGYK